MSPRDLVPWLRVAFERTSGDSEETRDFEPETASERAVKAPLNEIDTSGTPTQSKEEDPGMEQPD